MSNRERERDWVCKRERVYVTEIGREQRREGETVKEK